VTHEYTLLVGGTVIPGDGGPDVTAIAWAEDTILAVGTDQEVLAISRGDSHLVDLQGAWVVPLAPDADGGRVVAAGPGGAVLEVGGRADLAVLSRDPRLGPVDGAEAQPAPALAVIRGGRVVDGGLPGVHRQAHAEHARPETAAPG
jgi:predicted amidohydrolase YtcJ